MGKLKKMDKVDHTNTNAKRARMATLITDKVNFRTMKVTRDKDRHHTNKSVNSQGRPKPMHVTSNSFKTHEKKAYSTKRRIGKTHSYSFNILLSGVDRIDRQKIHKDI